MYTSNHKIHIEQMQEAAEASSFGQKGSSRSPDFSSIHHSGCEKRIMSQAQETTGARGGGGESKSTITII